MLQHNFKDTTLSALGLGCMRFPLKSTEQAEIDEAATADIVDYAIKNGINYFDTAWGYHGGMSEIVIGKLLKQYPRDSFYLATKFPGFKEETMADPAAVFEKQLEKCGVSHFDFYLCHNVCERNIDWFLNPKYGVVEYLIEQKKAGRIRHLGFSTHGSRAVIKRFLDAYGAELEFCQIQLNYLDWNLQSAKEKVELLNNYNISVWVMEPVRGGKLASLDEAFMDKLNVYRPGVSAAEWAFRFLQDIPGVTMILSGMSNLEQVKENIETFRQLKPLTKKERNLLLDISAEMMAQNTVPCTGCSYCTDRCPMNLPIPNLIKAFNEKLSHGEPGPAACIGCRSCESLCPQGIKISKVMEQFRLREQEK